MAGTQDDETNRYIIAALNASYEAEISILTSRRASLARIADQLV